MSDEVRRKRTRAQKADKNGERPQEKGREKPQQGKPNQPKQPKGGLTRNQKANKSDNHFRNKGSQKVKPERILQNSEFLAKRDNVDRKMVIVEDNDRSQVSILEDGILVEHYVSEQSDKSLAGGVYYGRVQNVLPSMEAAFIDIGDSRNGVLYAGEVNYDMADITESGPRTIDKALKTGTEVLVQVTKDPFAKKGARLTSEITLSGRFLVLVPNRKIIGISRRLNDREKQRMRKIIKEILPKNMGVIVRTAAEGASQDDFKNDFEKLLDRWRDIEKAVKTAKSPQHLYSEPGVEKKIVRDYFDSSFSELVISASDKVYNELHSYISDVIPDLKDRVSKVGDKENVFKTMRIGEQLSKAMGRKVWLPSGGTLVIDRTEAMTVIDVNTGKFTGTQGQSLEETVTANNLEAAQEIVNQMRLRDIGGIIVVDFIDMILEGNRDVVIKRLIECIARDRTRHQVTEITSLGLVQITRKRVGQGLIEAFSEVCPECKGAGYLVHTDGESIPEPISSEKVIETSETVKDSLKDIFNAANKAAEQVDAVD